MRALALILLLAVSSLGCSASYAGHTCAFPAAPHTHMAPGLFCFHDNFEHDRQERGISE